MAKITYPLAQILEIKKKRVEDAETVLKEKKAALAIEEEKLREREVERDRVLTHHNEQMRETMDHETTSPKIQQMKAYLKVVKEKLKVEEKKVKDQKEKVEIAEKNVEMARHDLNRKRIDVEKIETHYVSWKQEIAKEMEVIEGRENDDMGTVIFGLGQRNHKRLKES
jgi:flagellar biosynthesis chaperone FliJ